MSGTGESHSIYEPVYETAFENEAPSIAVVRALADFKGVDPVELDPLETAIDTDALDTLFRSERDDIWIQFRLDDLKVVVEGSGSIRLYDGTAPQPD